VSAEDLAHLSAQRDALAAEARAVREAVLVEREYVDRVLARMEAEARSLAAEREALTRDRRALEEERAAVQAVRAALEAAQWRAAGEVAASRERMPPASASPRVGAAAAAAQRDVERLQALLATAARLTVAEAVSPRPSSSAPAPVEPRLLRESLSSLHAGRAERDAALSAQAERLSLALGNASPDVRSAAARLLHGTVLRTPLEARAAAERHRGYTPLTGLSALSFAPSPDGGHTPSVAA